MIKTLLKKIFISAAMVPLVAHGQGKESYIPPTFVDHNRFKKIEAVFPVIDRLYKEYAEKNHFPGYAFGIMVDGKLVHSGSGGYADLNKKIPATTRSMFRIASMTKSFTAMAILKLRDQGRLQLDDPVYLYIPELKNQQLTNDAPVITIRHLLTHSAGFPEDNSWGDRQLSDTDEQLFGLFKKGISFSNVPGPNFEYSNLGFAMLGAIIKKVSGISYQAFIAKTIWQPLNMQQVAWEYTTVPADQLAHGYSWVDGHWKEEKMLHDGSYAAMGGMITSIDSFSQYVALHQAAWPPRDDLDTGPIKRSSIREMHHPWSFDQLIPNYKFADGRECAVTKAYAYGLRWLRDCESRTYVKHSGGLPGFGSNWTILPDYGIGVILFANATYAPTDQINLQVLDTLIKSAQLKPRQLPPSLELKKKQAALIKLLPDWKNAKTSSIFAENFFLDHSVDSLKKESTDLFSKAGKITHVGEITAENQLRGYFILKGEKKDLQINFALTPESTPLIQEYSIKEVL